MTVRSLFTAPIRFYQRVISPAIPARCRYYPTCSQYAVQAIRRYGVLRGIVLAGWRLLRCNPWSHGGIDHVEDQTLFRTDHLAHADSELHLRLPVAADRCVRRDPAVLVRPARLVGPVDHLPDLHDPAGDPAADLQGREVDAAAPGPPAGDEAPAGALQGRQAAHEPGAHEVLPGAEGQPARLLPPAPPADPVLHGAVRPAGAPRRRLVLEGDPSPGEDPGFLFIPDLSEKLTDNLPVLAVMVVLYIGTQLASTAVTAISADPTQRKIMFALPFVFTLFVINFPAGLLLYWITTNTWTIGQQLLVRKLYPKPEPIRGLRRGQTRARAREAAGPRRPRGRGGRTATTARGPSSRPPASGRQGREGHRRRQRREGSRVARKTSKPPSSRARSASGPGAGASGSLEPSRPRRPRTRIRDLVATVCDGIGIEGFSVELQETDEELTRPRSTARTSAC